MSRTHPNICSLRIHLLADEFLRNSRTYVLKSSSWNQCFTFIESRKFTILSYFLHKKDCSGKKFPIYPENIRDGSLSGSNNNFINKVTRYLVVV